MKIFLMSLTILFIYSHNINGQEIIKEHSVKKGETVYRISKIYNVSVTDIFALNPNSREVIYINDILLIPAPNNNSNKQLNSEKPISSVNNLKDDIYIVQKGDTKYGISRKFGVTISQLEENNPHIINGLQAEHKLSVNISQTNNTIQSYVPNEYLVKKGDTKYGLSKKFGVSITQLEQKNPHIINGLQANQILRVNSSKNDEVAQILNPQTYFVKKGDTKYGLSKIFNTTIAQLESANPEIVNILNYGITINIPQSKKDNETNNGVIIVEDSIEIVSSESTINIEDSKNNKPTVSEKENNNSNEYTNLRLTVNRSNPRKILLVLPFTKIEYEALNSNTKNINDSFLLKNVEFFRGANRAIDSVKALGVDIEMDILKIIPNNSENQQLSLDPDVINLNSYDGILSPFFQNETELISESINNKNIPIITLTTQNTNYKSDNIYVALPPSEIKKLKLINFLNAKGGNIILISDPSREINRSLVLAQTPNANIVDVRKQGENLNSELILALDKHKTNYVIIDSQKNNVFLNSTNLLLKQSSDYPIQLAVLETSLIPDSKSLSSKRFKVLNMIYPALKNQNNADSKILKTLDYMSLGYDITFDTLLRMSQPVSFETSAKQSKTKYSTLNIYYTKGTSESYFNHEVSIIEFNSVESLKSQND